MKNYLRGIGALGLMAAACTVGCAGGSADTTAADTEANTEASPFVMRSLDVVGCNASAVFDINASIANNSDQIAVDKSAFSQATMQLYAVNEANEEILIQQTAQEASAATQAVLDTATNFENASVLSSKQETNQFAKSKSSVITESAQSANNTSYIDNAASATSLQKATHFDDHSQSASNVAVANINSFDRIGGGWWLGNDFSSNNNSLILNATKAQLTNKSADTLVTATESASSQNVALHSDSASRTAVLTNSDTVSGTSASAYQNALNSGSTSAFSKQWAASQQKAMTFSALKSIQARSFVLKLDVSSEQASAIIRLFSVSDSAVTAQKDFTSNFQNCF